MRYLSLEFYKIRRRGIFLTALFLCGAEGAWTAYSAQQYLEENGTHLVWNNLFTNLALLHGLFLPMAIAVLASRICDMEHKGDTWKLLGSSRANEPAVPLQILMCVSDSNLYPNGRARRSNCIWYLEGIPCTNSNGLGTAHLFWNASCECVCAGFTTVGFDGGLQSVGSVDRWHGWRISGVCRGAISRTSADRVSLVCLC